MIAALVLELGLLFLFFVIITEMQWYQPARMIFLSLCVVYYLQVLGTIFYFMWKYLP